MVTAVALGGCHRTKAYVYTTPEPYPPPVVVTTTAQPQPYPPPVVVVPAVQPQPLLSAAQLDDLLAPIALYPDSLLAEILPACTYPGEVAWAWQWLRANPGYRDATIDTLNLDPSVKAVAHYPTVLQMLAEHAEWMQAIGAAFLAQQDDVLMSIQRLRAMAIEAQTLRSTPQQQVIVYDNYVEILPASPDVIHVPVYDPVIVYVRRPQPAVVVFSVRFTIGRWLGNCFDWHRRRVAVGAGWHPQWQYERTQWRPVDRGVTFTHGPTFSRATGPAAPAGPIAQQWSHNTAKPRPTLPAAQAVRRPGPPGQHAQPMVDIRPTRPTGDQRRPAPNQTTPPRTTPPQVVTPKPATPPTRTPPAATPTPERRPIPKPTTPPQVVTPKPATPPEVVTPKPATPPTRTPPPATTPIRPPTRTPPAATPTRTPPAATPTLPASKPTPAPTPPPPAPTRKPGPDSNSAKS